MISLVTTVSIAAVTFPVMLLSIQPATGSATALYLYVVYLVRHVRTTGDDGQVSGNLARSPHRRQGSDAPLLADWRSIAGPDRSYPLRS